MTDTAHAAEPSAQSELTSHAINQGLDALSRLNIDPKTLLRLPWDSLHAILGYLWPEAFWVLAASTGNGKSSTLMQLVHAWSLEGKRIYFLPLEQPAQVMRQYWAALANNLTPQHVLENNWDELPRHAKQTVAGHLRWQMSEEGGRYLVQFSPAQFVGEEQIGTEFRRAESFGASVMVIDHIHRLDTTGSNTHTSLVRLCQNIKEGAKVFKIPVIAAAQLHRDKEGDILAPFLPPKPTAIQGGEVVRQESDVALGLYRPLLDSFSPDDAREVRTGKAKIRPFLEPNTVGVHVLKHRVRGSALGEIVKLSFQHGRIVCQQTEERHRAEERLAL